MKNLKLKQTKLSKYLYKKFHSLLYHFDYLGVLNSPFKGLKLKWYFGKIQHGIPYFLPRKWVKMTKADCEEALQRDLENAEKHGWKYTTNRTWEYYKNHTKPVQIKYFGFDSCSLGWKTKWDDYRFEWSPCYSLVIFGKQICVWVFPNIEKSTVGVYCYWEAWLNYRLTDKTKSKEERIKELKTKYSCTWGNSDTGYVDYYPIILKEKYHERI